MSNPSPAGADPSVRGERRAGIVRLFVAGELDVSTAPMLEREIDAATEDASREGWRLCIVNRFGPVRDEFDATGSDRLLGSIAVSDLLDAGDEAWSLIPLPSLLGHRNHRLAHVARRSP